MPTAPAGAGEVHLTEKRGAEWHAMVRRTAVYFLLLLLMCAVLAACSSSKRNDAGGIGSSGGHEPSRHSSASSSADAGSDSADRAASDTANRAYRVPGNPQAAPGQLTAGEWRDVEQWDDWQKLLASREGADNERYWHFYRFERLVVRAEADGQPVADADVIVKDPDGRVVWRAKTDTDGYAYAYARLFESGPYMPAAVEDQQRNGGRERDRDPVARQYEENPDRVRPGYDVEVRAGGETKRFSHVPIPRPEPLVVRFGQAAEWSDAVDLMFVIDTTGSMQDEIDFLREELKDVIRRAREGAEALDIEVSVNFYRDRHDDYVVKSNPFTSSIDEAVSLIAAERAEGGGDYPEAVEQALTDAVSGHEWRRSARTRLLFLVADAPPRREPQIIDELHAATVEAAKLGIRIVPVASSGVDVNTEYLMRFLAAATGGTYVFLTDHSGIGDDHIEAAVGEFEVRPLNDLLVDIIRRYAGLPPEQG